MSEKLLYYIGAGASAQALPLVKDNPSANIKGLPTAMREMAANIRNGFFDITDGYFLEDFPKDLEWLAEESENFATIDTFCKAFISY